MPKIFCCYRRDDSRHQVGRIFDHLATYFGKHELFTPTKAYPAMTVSELAAAALGEAPKAAE